LAASRWCSAGPRGSRSISTCATSGPNFTLTTDLGDLDILGEIPGVGDFARVAADSSEMQVGPVRILVMDLGALERSKRAAGRAKDLLDLAEIAEIRRRSDG
jgi:hypothetical protein